MQPNKSIDMNSDQILNMFASENIKIKQDSDTFMKKAVVSFLAVFLVCSVFFAMPFAAKLLPAFDTQITDSEEIVKTSINAEYVKSFVWTAKLKLEDLRLNHRLTIEEDSNHGIRVEGSISIEEEANWKAFLNWYNSKTGFPKLQHSVDTIATSGNIPELKSVWFDVNPTAYFIDGRFGTIGTVLDDGWKIVSIEAWAVFIERDGALITLAY